MRLMENAEIVKPDVFGTKAKIMEENENETKYQMQCDTPNGFMHCYHLFPGIDLAYSTFEASSCRMRNRAMPNILEIAYCRAGRFECEYKHGFVTYLGEGDLAVSLLSPEREPPEFPIGYYDGVAFIIDLDITGLIFENVVEGVSINLKELIDKFCVGHCCSVIKTPPNLHHVFQEICEARDTVPMGYLRLKVLESLFLLSQMLPQENFETAAYYSANQIKKVKALKCELANQLDSRETLKSIADRYGMSLTALKDCFKAVYGKPIHAFQREYKMQTATKLLVTTKLSIAEIAGMVGYENPNKFSAAFKEIIGQSPSKYRKSRN